jgi:hypothetical protein
LNDSCDFIESREMPTTSAFALRKSLCAPAKSAPSVVQPGVLSLG